MTDVHYIRTPEDLLRLLRDNEEFREAVRRHILSDELIRLPERFAVFADRVETFMDRVETFMAEQHQTNAEQRQFNEEQLQFNAEQRQFNEEQRQATRRLETAVGELRGNAARGVVRDRFDDIVALFGFYLNSILTRAELSKLLPAKPWESDISYGDRQSFLSADLVVEAIDDNDRIHYVAVEASYTADERDTTRALRNSALLERLTGQPAYAVVASVRNVHEIQSLIDDGRVRWYQIDSDDFTPD
ncbi:MAG: hypothetical protein OXI54_04895 [Chloroflexota bacterium]|nr:hypothetical protein [Chloroflexota bacterium]MDE2683467.1 hypothetical protein [Chloroflexota bacterium]